MRRRWIPVVVAVIAMTMTGGPTSADHDVDASRFSGVMAHQAEDFEAVASNAAPNSSAPEGFAPCVNGMAAGTYPCDGIDMMSHLSLSDLGLSFGNDMWGWTDPQTRKDYALIGGTEGTVIVDISDSKRPDIVGTLPAHALDPGRPFWRDIKVHADHMFVVSEQTDHGMQVFDLTEVRGVTGPPVTFAETAHYDEISTSHNLNINTDTGFAYIVYTEGRVAMASNYTSGLRVYDTRNVSAGELSEVAFFDVYPENDNASFEGGTWSNYPYFRQKRIVGVSSIDRGLFVLRPRIGAAGN